PARAGPRPRPRPRSGVARRAGPSTAATTPRATRPRTSTTRPWTATATRSPTRCGSCRADGRHGPRPPGPPPRSVLPGAGPCGQPVHAGAGRVQFFGLVRGRPLVGGQLRPQADEFPPELQAQVRIAHRPPGGGRTADGAVGG